MILLGNCSTGDSVITGDTSLEAFNPELEARKVRTILLSVNGNSGIFSDQILFETLLLWVDWKTF